MPLQSKEGLSSLWSVCKDTLLKNCRGRQVLVETMLYSMLATLFEHFDGGHKMAVQGSEPADSSAVYRICSSSPRDDLRWLCRVRGLLTAVLCTGLGPSDLRRLQQPAAAEGGRAAAVQGQEQGGHPTQSRLFTCCQSQVITLQRHRLR